MNKLKLNPPKTEFLFIRNEQELNKFLSMYPIELFGVITHPAKPAGSLGIIFNNNVPFRSHV